MPPTDRRDPEFVLRDLTAALASVAGDRLVSLALHYPLNWAAGIAAQRPPG